MNSTARPLVVDMDGTLVNTDTLLEGLLALVMRRPDSLFRIPVWIVRGKAYLKHKVAQEIKLNVEALPYNRPLLEWLCAERATGRRLVLATGAAGGFAHAVAGHLGIFDEVMASDAQTNLTAKNKSIALVSRFGASGFDYVANHRDDLVVWRACHTAILVNVRPSLVRKVEKLSSSLSSTG